KSSATLEERRRRFQGARARPVKSPRPFSSSRHSGADVGNTDITGLLVAWRNGDRAAFDALLPLVCKELRILARRLLAGQDRRLLQTTDLVHDAYLKLAAHSRLSIHDRRHFFAIA